MRGEIQKWNGTKVIVLGIGRSGQAAAEWLLGHEAEVTMFDETKSAEAKILAQKWETRGVRVLLGKDQIGRAHV